MKRSILARLGQALLGRQVQPGQPIKVPVEVFVGRHVKWNAARRVARIARLKELLRHWPEKIDRLRRKGLLDQAAAMELRQQEFRQELLHHEHELNKIAEGPDEQKAAKFLEWVKLEAERGDEWARSYLAGLPGRQIGS